MDDAMPSILHRPSSIGHRPSSIVHRPSSIVHRPSSIVLPRPMWTNANTRAIMQPMKAIRTISPTAARRMAIARQRLAGPRPQPEAAGIMDILSDIGCLQLDPISAVARSHLLVLWSRLGPYDLAHLDNLLWQERQL